MKIVLSRKGFDSSAGGVPNPILPSGRLCMLPIPDRDGPVQYRNIQLDEMLFHPQRKSSLGTLVSQLTGRKISPLRRAHLDPDLQRTCLERHPDWRPLFGQRGAALGHLEKEGIGAGDLFLFFGWFRQTELIGPPSRRRIRFVDDAPDLHVLFGWLQVDQMLDLTVARSVPVWANLHPHVQARFRQRASGGGNMLYISRERLDLPTGAVKLPGGGLFPYFEPKLQLSKGDGLRSIWLLPKWFKPRSGRKALTYHRNRRRWADHPDGVLLRTVGRGQEFVLDGAFYPESEDWLEEIFCS